MLGPSFWLLQTASKTPQKEAIFDEEVSLSAGVLCRNAMGIAKWLNSEGEAGQRVMIVMPSGVTSAILYFAAMFAGKVAVPIDPLLIPNQLESIRRQIDPQWVFGPSLLKKIWNDPRFLTADGYEDLCQWMSPTKRLRDSTHPDDDPSRLLNIVYTSGTTGQPKGVMLNGANLEAVIRGILQTLRIDEESRIFSPLPFSHTYGLSQLWLMAKTGAALAVVPDIMKMATIKKILLEREINTIAGVPYHFAVLTRRGEKEKLDSIRLVTIAGEASSRHLVQKVRIAYPKARIHIMYGLTEATTRLTTLPSEDLERKEGSIGLPMEGVDLKILDEEGKELGPYEEGELIARGENITSGYWKDEKLTHETIINGWLHTGDIVKKDEEGYYYHVGRKDFIFKSGGEKIVPRVIERVLREIEGIRDAAVFGRKDAFIGTRICAVVVKVKSSNLTPGEILSICHTRLARGWVPHQVIFSEEIPRSSSGKIRFDTLKKQISCSKGKENGRKSARIDS
jgi:acyl-CoA synthetase (AMP-forming)/AMP-acid ligase II